jgi:nickel/cobalt transporter (NiCoT) family protein
MHVGGLIGTSVSALFLLVIAAINLPILRSIHSAFFLVKRAGPSPS